MMHLCACAAAPVAIKNKHSFSLLSRCTLTPLPTSKHTHAHTHTHVHTPSFFTWTNSSRTFLFFCLQSPPIATRSFMSPVGGGGNVREAHFSPTGADRSTPPNEKGKGVIVKHVSLQCQNTKQAQWLHPPSFASDVWKGIHPLIYGSWDKHPWTVLVC